MAVTCKLLEIPYSEIIVGDNEELRQKSKSGKFPVLETPDGLRIFESVAICKFLARKKRGFYGANENESKSTSII